MRTGSGAYADEAGAREALDKVCARGDISALFSLTDRLSSSQATRQIRTTYIAAEGACRPKTVRSTTTRVKYAAHPYDDQLSRHHQ